MKVLYFMNHVGRGGAALALLDLVKEIRLNHSYIQPIVITGSNNELNHALTEMGVENHSASFKNYLTTYRYPAFFWKLILRLRYLILRKSAIKKIERMVDFSEIDIIHSNLNRIDIGYYFANKYKIRHVWHIREDGFLGLRLMPIFSHYNPIFDDLESYFIVISKYVKQAWCSRSLPEGNVKLIHDGIRPDSFIRFQNKEKFGKLSFLFVGGFHDNKGQEIFIRALGLLPKVIKEQINVHFYGECDSHQKGKILKLISKLQLSNTCQIFDYDPNIYEKMSKYHIGVNCSKAEGFGRITVEYMMAGLCPLVSYGGANDEIVIDKVDSFMFDRDNSQEICDKVLYLYNNPDLIELMAIKAKENALKKFSMQLHASRICELYKTILE
jgi:glycosyltransferase involved in cell wall biosynthesis